MDTTTSRALLGRLTQAERVSLLSARDWWRTPAIQRDGVFIPHIKVRLVEHHWERKSINDT